MAAEPDLPLSPSKLDLRVRISRSKRVHEGAAKFAGMVCSPIGGLFFAFDDREGRVDIADIVAVCDTVAIVTPS